MALLFPSSHTRTPALLILTPPFSSSLTHPTVSPPSTISDERGRGCGRRRCKCHCCCCVCVSADWWQRNNNNAACPTSFIRLHKLIRPQRSHHLLYWEWRGEHWQEVWDLSIRMCSYTCVFVCLGVSVELGFDTCFRGRAKVCELLLQLSRDLKYCIWCASMCACVWVKWGRFSTKFVR